VSGQRNDINHLLATLGKLKGRVEDLGAQIGTAVGDAPGDPGAGDHVDAMTLLRSTLAELDEVERPADVPAVFRRLADRTGLRLLILKRWRSGLQVVGEHNIELPEEARHKLPNGRAPIPCGADDIFTLVGRDQQVYAGPVPIKAFPTDLTLLMGRGSQDRRVVIAPLPSQQRCSTFLYLDGEPALDGYLSVVEFLARHALNRMRLLQLGDLPRPDAVNDVLKHELHRRHQRQGQPAAVEPPSLGRRTPCRPVRDQVADIDVDWLTDEAPAEAPAERAPEPIELSIPQPGAAVRSAHLASEARAEADAIVEAWEEALLGGARAAHDPSLVRGVPSTPMDPAAILHESSDLPAMPKAALHILSVIDDPRTTATRLERAVAMDQALTAKILRIANSPFYGAVREIKTVSEAIVRLGFVTIRNWTLVTATRSVFLGAGATPLFHKIWRQSVLSAMAAQLVSQSLRRGEPETVFVGGLMQNIGQLVLARSHLDLFQQVLTISAEEQLPYHVVEQELLGFDHGDLGALLIKEWNLSEDLEQAVRWHHRLDHPDAQCAELAAMVALGEEVAACSGSADFGDGSEESWGPSLAAIKLGVTPDLLRRLRSQARDLSIDSSFFG
jgi:HD-like signal output (HDOD) protein